MAGDEDWNENPMEQHYYSLNFNSYVKGPGARIPMDRSLPSVKKESDRLLDPLKLYVAQIPLDMTDNGLRNHMSNIGCPKPTYMRLMRGKIGSTPCLYQYAFMTFESTREASEALQLLNRREPYFFKVNFANKPGEKERADKLRESQVKERDVAEDFAKYLTLKRSRTNEWQECTTFVDDNDNDVSTSSYSGLSNGSQSSPNQLLGSDKLGGDSSLQKLVNSGELVKFLKSGNILCNYCSMSPYIDHIHFIIDESRIYNPLTDLPELKDVSCQYCKKHPEVNQVCGKCKTTPYCSKYCQISDWSRHSSDCVGGNRENDL